MHPHHLTAIIGGLAVGTLLGYAFASQISSAIPSVYPKLILVS